MRCARFPSLLGLVVVALSACASLVDVDTQGVITSDKLDPVRDGRIFSLSARQNFAIAYGQFIMYGAWFSGEAISAETQPEVSEFDRRDVTPDNRDLLSLWTSLSVARETSERVVTGLSGTAGADANVDLARAALFAGYSYEIMAEHFCLGSAASALLDRAEMLRRAIDYFDRAQRIGTAASSTGSADDRAEASAISSAALIGRARAHLQKSDRQSALADARSVSPAFIMSMWYSDDPSNLSRLANTLWFHTALRGTLSIAPAFRGLSDPRVSVDPPATRYPSFDGLTPLWTQRKYPGYGASIRIASGMEAAYVAAEAQGVAAMLALIQQRRQAIGSAAYAGASDSLSVTREFMGQRAREFFLEGKRIGDMRRQPSLVSNLPVPGSAYHKAGFPPIRDQMCWPLPTKEIRP